MRMAAAVLAGGGGPSPHTQLSELPTDLVKVVWREVRSLVKRQERTVSCRDMYPFVRACWRVEAVDLSDGGRWVTDASLQALGCIPTLRSVRLTACRFITDAGLAFASAVPLESLDVSWTEVGDEGVSASIGRCTSLTSLNLTGLAQLSDRAISSLLGLTRLERLSLACTPITDTALDYLTYYTRYPDAAPARNMGVHSLRRLELSNTRLTDVGVGKLVAIIEDGTPYGKVFKELEYLALSSTTNVTPSAVRQVRTRYGFDTPLPNAQRTLAKSNAVALDAQQWVLRLAPSEGRGLPAPTRTWEQERINAYVAQYTKEMAASVEVIRMLTAVDAGGAPMHIQAGPGRVEGREQQGEQREDAPKRQRTA
jgi:hypothetical protein